MKLCVDCRYHQLSLVQGQHLCRATTPARQLIDPVTGNVIGHNFEQCHLMRSGTGKCGPNGKFWEARDVE